MMERGMVEREKRGNPASHRLRPVIVTLQTCVRHECNGTIITKKLGKDILYDFAK